jgi:hypothetical protein
MKSLTARKHSSIWRLNSWDRASSEQRCKQPKRCNKFRLLILLLIYLNLLYRFLATNSPTFANTFDSTYGFGRAISVHCTKGVYTFKKCSWKWVSLSPETCRPDSNRWIIRSINESCWILLIAYIHLCFVQKLEYIKTSIFFFFLTAPPPSGPGPPHFRGFPITYI